jgi:hypothetical protein
MSQTVANIRELFGKAIELERAAETLYESFADFFAEHRTVASFWKHYADEEGGHAAYLERVLESLPADRLLEPANSHMLRGLNDCLRAASPDRLSNVYNLEDAFQLATELENSETNAIFEFIIMNFSTDELAKSHKFLRAQLSSHINKLQEAFPVEFRSVAARQSVVARKIKDIGS